MITIGFEEKDWDQAEQVQCSKCGCSDFHRLEIETWWSKEKPFQKHFIKRILMECRRCKARKQVFFPNMGWIDPLESKVDVENFDSIKIP